MYFVAAFLVKKRKIEIEIEKEKKIIHLRKLEHFTILQFKMQNLNVTIIINCKVIF